MLQSVARLYFLLIAVKLEIIFVCFQVASSNLTEIQLTSVAPFTNMD